MVSPSTFFDRCPMPQRCAPALVALAGALLALGSLGPTAPAHAAQARAMAARPTPPSAPPASVRRVAAWALASGDARGQPFVVIDKPGARVWVFDARARAEGHSPVLLGLARGDDSVPGIGERPVLQILPHERTTPAGRFVAEPGQNHHGEDIVWVDYDAAVSMHRVRATNPKERRLERLASATVADNRISYGCINVPAAFYDAHIKPLFASGPRLVYVLPDSKPLAEVFRFDAGATAAAQAGAARTD